MIIHHSNGVFMTSIMNDSNSKWIAAIAAAIFVLSAAAVCSDTADAAGSGEETLDVDETLSSAFSLISAILVEEPSSYAKVISSSYDVSRSGAFADLVLKNGAVLNFSNSSVLAVDNLFIDGNVKIVNKDGTNFKLLADKVFISGIYMQGGCKLFTDKSVTIDAKEENTGFYDPASGTFDPSKGLKGSVNISVYVDGYMSIADSSEYRIYSGSGSPAAEAKISYNLDGFYRSLKNNLDGLVLDKNYAAKIVDYLYGNMVYPDADASIKIAKASGKGTTISDASITLVSSQASKGLKLGMSIGSGEGNINCSNLSLNASISLSKAEITGSAGSLIVRNAGSAAGASGQSAEFQDLKFEFSSRGDKIIDIVVSNILNGPQAVMDALTDSDASISGTSSIQAGIVKASGPVAADGIARNIAFDASGFELRTDVSSTGTSFKGSLSKLDLQAEGKNAKETLKLTGFSESLSTNGKNVFSILKFVRIDGNDRGYGDRIPHVDADYKAAILDYLNGATIKGDISVGTLDLFSAEGVEGINYKETKLSLTGNDRKNFQSSLDIKIAADRPTEKIRLAGTVSPSFSGSAVLYTKVLTSDSKGINGGEIITKNMKVDVKTFMVDAYADDFTDPSRLSDAAEMKLSVKADVERNSWSTGTGRTAYAEKIAMADASFDSDVAFLADFSAVDLSASSGNSMKIDSYRISDRGSCSMTEFADVVAKADSSSMIKGSSYEYKYDESGTGSLYLADAETVIGGTDVKYSKISDTEPAAYLVKNEAGYYDVSAEKTSGSIAAYNVQGKSLSSGDSTMLYIAIAIIALVLVALAAFLILRKRGSGA